MHRPHRPSGKVCLSRRLFYILRRSLRVQGRPMWSVTLSANRPTLKAISYQVPTKRQATTRIRNDRVTKTPSASQAMSRRLNVSSGRAFSFLERAGRLPPAHVTRHRPGQKRRRHHCAAQHPRRNRTARRGGQLREPSRPHHPPATRVPRSRVRRRPSVCPPSRSRPSDVMRRRALDLLRYWSGWRDSNPRPLRPERLCTLRFSVDPGIRAGQHRVICGPGWLLVLPCRAGCSPGVPRRLP